MEKIITSQKNPKVKQVLKLRKAKNRKEEKLIIIEGRKEINFAVKAGLMIKDLFYCSDLDAKKINPDTIMSRSLVRLSSAIFNKISYREHPDGFLALAEPRYLKLNDLVLSDNPFLIILESVEKPGNLGAILRSADAGRADAVIVCDPRTDIFNPNVIRASLGAVFTNQVVACSTLETIEWLKRNNIRSFAAAPQAELVYTAEDYSGPSAIVIGAEHEGLSEKWLSAAGSKIKIPMRGKVDSLNASVSAAIILFEAIRQRENKT